MDFKEWLKEYDDFVEKKSASKTGEIKTNFSGSTSISQLGFTESQNYQSNKFSKFKTRVESGKRIENKIINALREHLGWEILNPSAKEDKYDKIDGWLVENEQKKPIQVKYRDKNSGSDIFMELMKDCDNRVPGRDMVGKAEIYITLSNDGKTIMIRNAHEAKEIATEMMAQLEQSSKTRLTTSKGTIMISPDPATKIEKLKAYIDPNAFSWKKNITLDRSLH